MRNCFFFLCLWGCLSPTIQAQTTDSIQPIPLEEVWLKNDSQAERQLLSPTPVQALSGKTLKRLSNFSVADAMRYFSGVQLKDYGGVGGLKTINVRSMGAQHTGVFYDGIRITNAQNGQVDLGKFSLNNMEAVALYQGQRSDLNQSAKAYASASSLYLTSKKPEFQNHQKFHLATSVKTGSFGLFNPAVNLDYKIDDYLSLRVSTEYQLANGRYKFDYSKGQYDTTAYRKNADIQAFRFETSLFGQGKQHEWQLKYYHYNSERGLPGAVVANVFDRPQHLWDRSDFIQGKYKTQFSEAYTLTLRSKYSKSFNRYVDPEIITTSGLLDNKYHQEEWYFSAVNTLQLLPFWKVSLASDLQYNTMKANLYRFAFPKRLSVLNALATDFEFNRLHLQASLLSTLIDESVKYYQAGKDINEFTPTAMLSWQPFRYKAFRVRSFYKRIFRMPTFNDLYYTFVGNTFLNPEFATQFDIGVVFQPHWRSFNFDIQLSTYKAWITDKIVAVPGANLFRWTMLNLGKVETTGLEFNAKVQGQLAPEWQLTTHLAYTYQKSIDVTPGGNAFGDQIPYIPLHSGSLGLMLDYRQLQLNYSFIYTGERYSQKANINSNYLQPWYTHDLGLGYTFTLKGQPLKLGAEINNLFDQQYAVIKNFPMPGRSYRFTVTYHI